MSDYSDFVGVNSNPPNVTQQEAQAGTEEDNRSWSPLRVREATDSGGIGIATQALLDTKLDHTNGIATGIYESVVNSPNTNTSYNIDVSSGNIFDLTVTGAVDITFSGSEFNKFSMFTLNLFYGSDYSVTWDAVAPSYTIVWANGNTQPTLSQNDTIVFYTLDNGATWYGHHITGSDVGVPAVYTQFYWTQGVYSSGGDTRGGVIHKLTDSNFIVFYNKADSTELYYRIGTVTEAPFNVTYNTEAVFLSNTFQGSATDWVADRDHISICTLVTDTKFAIAFTGNTGDITTTKFIRFDWNGVDDITIYSSTYTQLDPTPIVTQVEMCALSATKVMVMSLKSDATTIYFEVVEESNGDIANWNQGTPETISDTDIASISLCKVTSTKASYMYAVTDDYYVGRVDVSGLVATDAGSPTELSLSATNIGRVDVARSDDSEVLAVAAIGTGSPVFANAIKTNKVNITSLAGDVGVTHDTKNDPYLYEVGIDDILMSTDIVNVGDDINIIRLDSSGTGGASITESFTYNNQPQIGYTTLDYDVQTIVMGGNRLISCMRQYYYNPANPTQIKYDGYVISTGITT